LLIDSHWQHIPLLPPSSRKRRRRRRTEVKGRGHESPSTTTTLTSMTTDTMEKIMKYPSLDRGTKALNRVAMRAITAIHIHTPTHPPKKRRVEQPIGAIM